MTQHKLKIDKMLFYKSNNIKRPEVAILISNNRLEEIYLEMKGF
jgi:hypothetical protein